MHFVTPLLLSKNIGNDILDDGSPTDVCSHVFTKACEKGRYPSANRRAVGQAQRNVEKDGNIIDIVQQIHALLHEEFLPVSVCRARGSGERYTQMECIHTTSSAFSILNLRPCVAGWNYAAGLLLIPI